MMESLDSKKTLPLLKDTHTYTARQVSRKCGLVPKSLVIRQFPVGCDKNAIYRRDNRGSKVVAPSKSNTIQDKEANDFNVKANDVPLGITKIVPNNLTCLEKQNFGCAETIFKVLKESESNVVAPLKANISDEQVDEEGCALGFVRRSPNYGVSSEAQSLGYENTIIKEAISQCISSAQKMEVKRLSLSHDNNNFLLLIDQEGHKSTIGSTNIDMRSKYFDLAKKTDNVSRRNQIPFESSGVQRPSKDLSEVKDLPNPIKLSDQPAAQPLAPSASVERRPAAYSSEVNYWREPIKISDQLAAQPLPPSSSVEPHSSSILQTKDVIARPICKRYSSFRRVSAAIRVFPSGCGKSASRDINGLTSEAAVSLDNRTLVDATSSAQVVAPQSTNTDVEDGFNMRTTTREEPQVENRVLKKSEKDYPIGYGSLDISRLTSEAAVSSENCTLLHANSSILVAAPQSTNKDAEHELTMRKAMKEVSHLEIVALKNAEKDILPKNKETKNFPVGPVEQRIIMANNDEKALVATTAVKRKTEEDNHFPVIMEALEPIRSDVEKVKLHAELQLKLPLKKRRLEPLSYDALLKEGGTGYTEDKIISSGSEDGEPINSRDYSARKKLMEKLSLFRATYHKLLMEEYKGTVSGMRTDLVAHKFYKAGNSRCDDHHKYLGNVPGVEVGDKFHRRVELCVAGLHSQPQAGIDYMKQNGTSIAVSIVSSGRYANDTADTDVLLYSGSGVPNQDQKLNRGNLALKNSMDAQIPVRVIYGFKKHKYRAKTVTTYIYDGLYLVENFWCEMGDCGHKIFIFCLRRIGGQREGIIGVERSGSPRVHSYLSAADISQGNEDIPIPVKNLIEKGGKPKLITWEILAE